MICPICGRQIQDNAKFCGKCGKQVPRCPSCGKVLYKRIRFCSQDGTAIPEHILQLIPETPPAPVQETPQQKPVQQQAPVQEAPRPKPVQRQAPVQKPPQQKPNQPEKSSNTLKVLLIILIAAFVLGIAAGAGYFFASRNSDKSADASAVEKDKHTAPPAKTAKPAQTPNPSAKPTPEPVYIHRYEVIPGDVSWAEAKAACESRGGHLATITSESEYNEICAQADASGLTYLWIGGYPDSSADADHLYAWITGEDWTFEKWYPNEPSQTDTDGTQEDCLCLWNAKYQGTDIGWTFNDQRNSLLAAFPSISGKIGYLCEYDIEVNQ